MKNSTPVALEITDLAKTYAKKTVLDRLSFSVYEGEFLAILGPSGCGKSTLLRILIGLTPPDGGTITSHGADITKLPPAKRRMGIVFQNYALFANMTVIKNVEYALLCQKENRAPERKAAIHQRAVALLTRLGLADEMQQKPGALSGGQQQRVAIARTLMLNPEIILFDEPMAALDVAVRLALRQEIKALQREFGTTMIYITHDQEEAFALADRIMVMSKAKIEQIDTPKNLVAHPANAYVEDFVVANLQQKIDSLAQFVRGKKRA